MPDRLFGWKSRPEPEPPTDRMREDAPAKVGLVLPLDLGHGQEAVDPVFMTRSGGVPRRDFVLADVPALELPGTVHRSEPSCDMAQRAETPPDQPSARFRDSGRNGAQLPEHLADVSAMEPLFVLDEPDAGSVLSLGERLPVASVGVRRGELSRVGETKERDEIGSGGLYVGAQRHLSH